VLIGAVTAVIVLGAAGAMAYLLNRAPATEGDRSPSAAPPATRSSPDREPSPATEETASADLRIPAAFEGDWSGHTSSTNPNDSYGAHNTVELVTGDSAAYWTEENIDGECEGTIILSRVQRTRLTFSLGENEGGCVPGTIWLDLQGDRLTYTWRDVPGPGLVTQTGALSKN
jgi:hypothetical protein